MKSKAKLLQNSKKAFTLVELVVVIAVLAIIAAIAIPSVMNIINSTSESRVKTDAASIDSAVKAFHAGIVGGSINSGNVSSEIAAKAATFPAANASNNERTAYANTKATVEQAMMYEKIWDKLGSSITNFGYKDGAVVAAVDGDGEKLKTPGLNVFTDGTTSIGTVLSGK